MLDKHFELPPKAIFFSRIIYAFDLSHLGPRQVCASNSTNTTVAICIAASFAATSNENNIFHQRPSPASLHQTKAPVMEPEG